MSPDLRLGLACTPGLEALARPVGAALAATLPGLRLGGRRTWALPQAAFDTARGWYDAPFLLSEAMPAIPGCAATLWLVAGPLGDSWRPWILGAALSGGAVVSTLRLGSVADVAKVAAHEVGHLLGLGHCDAACLMRVAVDESRLAAIPLALCDACRNRLA